MSNILYTLLSDGSSDQTLMPILSWLLRRSGVEGTIQDQWPDLRRLPQPPRSLPERIQMAVDLSPCQLLFIHRDAEGMPLQARKEEIEEALNKIRNVVPPAICVVPVRMQEAWLLFDERALRKAAGNPNGEDLITMPRLADLESLADPKDLLYRLLRDASGLQGRRRRQFRVQTAARRVADFIEDFSPLLALGAFAMLESDVQSLVRTNGWND